jgi:hypothetical protein
MASYLHQVVGPSWLIHLNYVLNKRHQGSKLKYGWYRWIPTSTDFTDEISKCVITREIHFQDFWPLCLAV